MREFLLPAKKLPIHNASKKQQVGLQRNSLKEGLRKKKALQKLFAKLV